MQSSFATLLVAGAACSALAIAPGAQAQTDVRWKDSTSGLWFDRFRWDPQIPPTSRGERAIIERPGIYTVAVPVAVEVGGLVLRNPDAMVRITGALSLVADAALNEGTIAVLDTGLLDFPKRTELIGGGTIQMLGAGALLTGGAGSAGELRQGPDHHIFAVGRIMVDVYNRGVITAHLGRLEIFGRLTNAPGGTVRIVGPGSVVLHAPVIQEPAARLYVMPGGELLVRSIIEGGTIESELITDTLVDAPHTATLINTTILGEFGVANAATLALRGRIVNQGEILVNTSDSTVPTFVRLADDVTLSGDGEMRLAGTSGASRLLLSPGAEGVLTNGAGHTISGAGQVRVELVNEGYIVADRSGRTLELLGAAKANNATMGATGGGRLRVSADLEQAPEATLKASDGGVLELGAGAIIGGSLDAKDGVARTVAAGAVLDGVTIHGRVEVADLFDLTLVDSASGAGGSVTNHGTVVVGVDGWTNSLLRTGAGLTLAGAGAIHLNGEAAAFRIAAVGPASAEASLENGPEHTIAGQGMIHGAFTNAGILSPGGAALAVGLVGELTLEGDSTMAESSRLEIELAGPGAHDRLLGERAIELGGDLTITLLDGFEPELCASFEVLSAARVEGAFDRLIVPDAGEGRRWRIDQTATAVELRLLCRADLDGDCDLTFFDFVRFQDLFAAGDPQADFDGDEDLTFFDFLAFQSAFASGCR